jgi:hypothetical protein
MSSSDMQSKKDAIQSVIKDLMDRVMNRVLVEDPFIKEKHHADKPLYAALVPDEIFKGSHFERRFVTPFGSAWEDLAVAAAKFGLGYGVKGHNIFGKVKSERLARITQILNRLEHPEKGKERQKPDWDAELAYVLKGGGEDIPVQIVCDVYAEDITKHKKYAFELKAPLPNSDQTKVSKEKLLKLYSMSPRQIDAAYYALPYNPYGKRENYSWSFPARWFNMKEDKSVLIGDEFWEKIGGLGTYQAFISAVNEIGKEYKERIYREFLGIEPPGDFDQGKLR